MESVSRRERGPKVVSVKDMIAQMRAEREAAKAKNAEELQSGSKPPQPDYNPPQVEAIPEAPKVEFTSNYFDKETP